MKNEIKPLWIGLAAVGAVILLVVLYKAFLAEPPMPAPITQADEAKYKGMNAQNYAASNMQQHMGGGPGGQQGSMQQRMGQGYGGGQGGYGGGQGGYGGAPR